MNYYILKGRKTVKAKSLQEACNWYENFDQRQIASTVIHDIRVSTVFLMMDHRLFGDGPPVLFETMVFSQEDAGVDIGDWTQRYCTYEAAVTGHNQVVEEVRAMIANSIKIAQTIGTSPTIPEPKP